MSVKVASSDIARLKTLICVLNVVLGSVALAAHGELFGRAILGVLIVGLGPIVWNEWLHKELFSTERGRLIMTYRNFEMIGLLAAVGVLLVVAHSLFIAAPNAG